MSLILLKCSELFGVVSVCICVCTMQVLVHVEYSDTFDTASASEMSFEGGDVCNQTVILDRIVNKQKKKFTSANCLNILDTSILLQLVTLLLWYHCKKSVTWGGLACLSSPVGEGVQAHWEPAKCVWYDSELLASPDSQQQGVGLSVGEKGGWEGHCRAPVHQRGPSILMPPTAEPSAGYYT